MIKKILGSSLLLLIANSFGRLAMFLANIFAARILDQASFGQFMTLRNTISLMENIVSGAFGNSAIKHIAQLHNETSKLCKQLVSIFFVYLVISVSLSLVIILFSDVITKEFFLSSPLLKEALPIGAFLLLFSIMSIMTQNILIGLELYKLLTTISVAISLVMIPVILYLINQYQFFGAIYSIVLYFLFDFIIKIYFIFKKIDFKVCQLTFIQLKQNSFNFISFSLPLLISIILTSSSFWYARIMLINNSGTFENIAIFDAAFQWLTIIMIITGATTSVALPMLSKISVHDSLNTSNKIFYINLLVNFVIAFSLSMIFIYFSKEIMSIYGQSYVMGAKVLKILAITSIFFSLSSILNKYMIAKNKINTILYVTIGSLIIMFLFLINNTSNSYNLAISFLIFYFCLTSGYYLYIKVGNEIN